MGAFEMMVFRFRYLCNFLKLPSAEVDHVVPRFIIHATVRFHCFDQSKVVEISYASLLKATLMGSS